MTFAVEGGKVNGVLTLALVVQENIGAMQITGVGSKRVVQIGAVVAIIFGLIGKPMPPLFTQTQLECLTCQWIACASTGCLIHVVACAGKIGGLFASMPQAMVSGLFCVMFALIGKYHSSPDCCLNQHRCKDQI